MTVTPLKTVTKACNEDAIKILEEALELAKGGEITTVAIAAVTHKGAIMRSWSCGDPVAPLLGAIAVLAHDLASQVE